MTCGTFLQSESGFCVGKEPEWAGAEVREQLRALEQFQKVLHLDANLGGAVAGGRGAEAQSDPGAQQDGPN